MKLILSRLGVFSGFTHILSKFKLQTREVFGGGISCNGIYVMNWKDPLENPGNHLHLANPVSNPPTCQ
jgi:hypothetical protein